MARVGENGLSFFHRSDEDAAGDTDPSRSGRFARRLAAVIGAAGVAAAAVTMLPASSASADPSANDWFRLRMCESSSNYSINTGNGYYGAYQFDLPTWRSVGGTGYPNQASPGEQDARALMLYRMRGWQPWTCATILGFRDDADAGSGRISDIHVPGSGGGASSSSPRQQGGAPAMPGGDQWFSYGDVSPVIRQWQDQMHARGFFPVGTGDFGPHTLAVVKRIQALNGLSQTGILGPFTWKLAWTGRYSNPPSTPAPTSSSSRTAPPMPGGNHWYSYGDHNSTIKRWQDQMHARGLFPVGTGDFGANTLAAVKHIQAANGLPQTGILGPVTWKLAWTGRY